MTATVDYMDSSLYNRKPIQLNGSPSISSLQKVFGDASGYFPASTSIQYFHASWQALAVAEWGFAFRIQFKTTVASVALISTGGVASAGYHFEFVSPGTWKFTHTTSAQVILFSHTPTADTWYYVALLRITGKLHLYVNGTLISSTTISPAITDHTTNPLKIGAISGSANIYIDEFIFQVGTLGVTVDSATVARPTAEITPGSTVYLYLKFNQVPVTFIESRFPTGISYGASGGPVSNTNIITTKAGLESRNVNWPNPIRRYNAQYGIRNKADLDAVLHQHLVCQGKSIGFRYKDWSDFKSCGVSATPAFTDQTIGTGDGTTKAFQLIKQYSFGGYSVTRTIKKPVAGTVVVGINGVSQGSGFTVDTVNGLVYFDTAPGNGLSVTAGFEFDVPVRFDIDNFSIDINAPQLASTAVVLVEDMNENNR